MLEDFNIFKQREVGFISQLAGPFGGKKKSLIILKLSLYVCDVPVFFLFNPKQNQT
jgi:hypothetical protein